MNQKTSSEMSTIVSEFSNLGNRITNSVGDMYSVGRKYELNLLRTVFSPYTYQFHNYIYLLGIRTNLEKESISKHQTFH